MRLTLGSRLKHISAIQHACIITTSSSWRYATLAHFVFFVKDNP